MNNYTDNLNLVKESLIIESFKDFYAAVNIWFKQIYKSSSEWNIHIPEIIDIMKINLDGYDKASINIIETIIDQKSFVLYDGDGIEKIKGFIDEIKMGTFDEQFIGGRKEVVQKFYSLFLKAVKVKL